MKVQPPAGRFRTEITVPGDKSLSHRALILAAMARGESQIVGVGPGRDVASTTHALEALGVEFEGEAVHSGGVEAWHPARHPLDVENSATSMRLLAGALAARVFRTTLTGDESLRRRPMDRLVAPLEALGARVDTSPLGTAPIAVGAAEGLVGADVAIDIPSGQVRSAFALAAVQAEGASTIDSPGGFRDHTERWLSTLGLGRSESTTRFSIAPGPVPPHRYEIPGDPSSAAFLWVAAAMVPGASATTPQVSLNPGRLGLLEVIGSMGGNVRIETTGDVLGDPIGSVTVEGSDLAGVEVQGETTVRCLDEIPLVAILGAAAEGETVVRDAAELRVKESDRITRTVELISALGGDCQATDDGLVVRGVGRLGGGRVDAGGDHRIAMTAAVAAALGGEVEIEGHESAAVSWPGFYEALESTWSSR